MTSHSRFMCGVEYLFTTPDGTVGHMVAVARSLGCPSPSPPSGEHRSGRSESGDDWSPSGAGCGRWLWVPVMVRRLQLWIGLLLFVSGVSYPVAYAAARFLHLNFVASFAAIAFSLLLAILCVFKYVRGPNLLRSLFDLVKRRSTRSTPSIQASHLLSIGAFITGFSQSIKRCMAIEVTIPAAIRLRRLVSWYLFTGLASRVRS